jgi:hypothetical protein
MANVIGGEYKIPLIGIETKESNNGIFFASGRGGFAAILRKIIVDKNAMHEWGGVMLPDYLCSSITQVCIDEKISYQFYHIKDNLLPDEEQLMQKVDDNSVVLLISYFGMINVENVADRIKKQNPNVVIILDDVQNYYSRYSKSAFWDYRFNSYRKWFAVPDGAEVFCKSGSIDLPNVENTFAQYKFSGNVLKNFSEWIQDKLYLDLIGKGEEILDTDYNCKCSQISRQLIPQISFEKIKAKRVENASFLHSELEKLGIKHIYCSDCVPLFIPVFLKNRKEIRMEMFKNKIFTPIHWPYESEMLNGSVKNQLYETELSLICDQRYFLDDMQRQLDILCNTNI